MTTPTTDTDGGQWLPMADAAAALQVSGRTLTRWVSSGKVRTMLSANGRRAVLVPNEARPVHRVVADTADSEGHAADEDRRELALVSVAIEQAQRSAALFAEAADDARDEVVAARRWGRLGWSAAAVLLVGAAVAAVFVSSTLTGQRMQLDQLAADRADLAVQLDEARGTLDVLASFTAAKPARRGPTTRVVGGGGGGVLAVAEPTLSPVRDFGPAR